MELKIAFSHFVQLNISNKQVSMFYHCIYENVRYIFVLFADSTNFKYKSNNIYIGFCVFYLVERAGTLNFCQSAN